MLNDTDTQAKRLLIWQDLLATMPAEHRRFIEQNPKGEMFHRYSGVVAQKLAEWQAQRTRLGVSR